MSYIKLCKTNVERINIKLPNAKLIPKLNLYDEINIPNKNRNAGTMKHIEDAKYF